jgi:N-acetylglutamate synthase-like GNAT family acetyltransferase
MAELRILKTEYGSDIYRKMLLLREAVLRKPLGLKLSPEELQKDVSDHHIAALLEDAVVGCLVLMPLPDKTIKMRQVAVLSDKQRSGIGKSLILWTEDFSRSLGFSRIILHSRETAVGFYEKLGYKKTGQPFIEVTLPHWAMEKEI